MVLRAEGVMAGHIGFHSQPDAAYLAEFVPGGVEYGYTGIPRAPPPGGAREACRALMAWASERHGVSTFVLSIRPDNQPS